MGTVYAPAYAKSLESKYIYRYTKEKVIEFLWFIDYLFMIWTGAK